MLARALAATGTERSRVLEVAEAQARGDARAVLSATPACARQPACVSATTAFVDELKRGGRVEILQYEPERPAPAHPRHRHRPRRLAGGREPAGRAVRARPPRRPAVRREGRAALDLCPDRQRRRLPLSATAQLPAGGRVEIRRDGPPAIPPAAFSALLVLFPAAAHAQKPDEQALYQDGPDGRYLLDGDWLFRLDPADQGVKQRWMRSTSKAGWSTVKVPNVWNLGDAVQRVDGGRDRLVPQGLRAARARTARWRGPSASSRSTTARGCGSTARRSARTRARTSRSRSRPRTRPSGAGRTGSSCGWTRKRLDSDFPPAGQNADGVPSGGWWNYCGIQREVYLKKLDTVDFQKVLVRPEIACGTCDATRAHGPEPAQRHRSRPARHAHRQVRGPQREPRDQDDRRRTGSPRSPTADQDRQAAACGRRRTRTSTTSRFTVRVGGDKVAGYSLHSGIRSIKVSQGRLFLNGAPINIRGMGLHEDSKAAGLRDRQRAPRGAGRTSPRKLGGTVLRTHYPLHPYTHELADRLGLLIW